MENYNNTGQDNHTYGEQDHNENFSTYPEDREEINLLHDTEISFDKTSQEDVTIDDADLCEIEEWFEAESRNVENLKQECHNLLRQCAEKSRK